MSSACRSALPALLSAVCKPSIPWTADADTAAEKWHALLSRPLPKGIKYARALQRLLDRPATLYAGVEYKDVSLFLDEDFASTVQSPLDADGWRTLQAINRLVSAALGIDLDRVPTREEIHQNIQAAKKKPNVDAGSVAQACKLAYAGLGEGLDDAAASKALADRAAATDDKELTSAWTTMLQGRPSFVDECVKRTPPPTEAWTAVPAASVSALQRSLRRPDSKSWAHVDQLNGYAKISSNIPTGVMSRIETMASSWRRTCRRCGDHGHAQPAEHRRAGPVRLQRGRPDKTTGNIGDLLPVLSQMAPGAMPPMK